MGKANSVKYLSMIDEKKEGIPTVNNISFTINQSK